jgi:hypothetical protein
MSRLEENKHFKILKLVTGENIISAMYPDDERQDVFHLEEPYLLKSISHDPADTTQMVTLAKWNPYTPDEYILLGATSIVTVSNVKDDLLEYYQQVSTDMKDEGVMREDEIDEIPTELYEETEVEIDEDITADEFLDMIRARKGTVH